jgi:methylisocitrate lyase
MNSSTLFKGHPGRVLRDLMKKECVMAVGAFNGLIGRMLAKKGFKASYVSGAAISGATGQPDIGLVTASDFTRVISDVYISSKLPIISDADTGFGEGEMLAKTVWEYNKAGAAGFHIEDQVFPKRCGHLDGKSLITSEDMENKIRVAAKASIECSNGDFIICARTDARGVISMEEALKRASNYIKAGADMIFPEGLETEDEFKHFSTELRKDHPEVFLLANLTEFGKTPNIPFQNMEKIGYNFIIYPVTTLRIAMKAIENFLDDLQENGTVVNSLEKMQHRKDLYDLLNYKPGVEWIYPSPKSPKSPKK